MSPLVTSLVGVLLGMRHALEPDHLAAVTALASEHRSRKDSLALGAWWGLGHALTLLVVGGSLSLLGAQMPERLELAFEALVAAVIVVLGLRAVVKALREGARGPVHVHAHGELLHTHAAPAAHVHLSRWTLATRPLLVGVLHGLAGSGGLTALALVQGTAGAGRLVTIALFGAGSALGMALLTGLLGLPLQAVARSPVLARRVSLAAGLLSTAVGAWWGASALAQLGA